VTDKTPLHIRQADGLRQLADMIENNPTIAQHLAWALDDILCPASTKLDVREQLTTLATVAKTADAAVTIKNDNDTCHVIVTFGPVSIRMYASAARMAGNPEPKPTPDYTPLVVDD
jgi:hypothetical protein